ncbi:MAG: NUDIX domain-containing protein [Bacteroidetes bacterium]|nr:NUDIX domain-containing protein [Bacteroidota bacterium]
MENERVIVNEYDGKLTNSYKELLKLKGVGQYTAAAIASIAFCESVAVVDGNVYRLLSRFFGISTPIDDKTGVTEFALKSNELLGTHNPGIFNQAIMELGALVCLPNNPKCDSCPLRDDCVALKEDRISMLPVKEKRLKKRKRFFNYLFIKNNERTYLHKREAKDIWQGLYEFPLIETNTFANRQTFTNCKDWKRILKNSNYKILEVSDIFSQTLTHQRIEARFWEIEIDRRLDLSENNFIETGMDNVNDYPFPKIMICYLDEIVLVLQ